MTIGKLGASAIDVLSRHGALYRQGDSVLVTAVRDFPALPTPGSGLRTSKKAPQREKPWLADCGPGLSTGPGLFAIAFGELQPLASDPQTRKADFQFPTPQHRLAEGSA
jgi:hypothetical protein